MDELLSIVARSRPVDDAFQPVYQGYVTGFDSRRVKRFVQLLTTVLQAGFAARAIDAVILAERGSWATLTDSQICNLLRKHRIITTYEHEHAQDPAAILDLSTLGDDFTEEAAPGPEDSAILLPRVDLERPHRTSRKGKAQSRRCSNAERQDRGVHLRAGLLHLFLC